MDAFGSSSTAVGGVFGRVDAVYGSLECQKSGAYHMHAQLFVECYHQFTPLQDLMRLGAEPRLELLRKYSSYTAHVRRTIYSNPKAWQEEEQADVEAQWPEYKESHLMLSRPLYQKDADMEPQDWKVIYLNTVSETQTTPCPPSRCSWQAPALAPLQGPEGPDQMQKRLPSRSLADGRAPSDLPRAGRVHGHALQGEEEHGRPSLGAVQQSQPQRRPSSTLSCDAWQQRCPAPIPVPHHSRPPQLMQPGLRHQSPRVAAGP